MTMQETTNPTLAEELKEIRGLPVEEDRFDNMTISMMAYPAFQAKLNELLEVEGCHLEQPPKKGTKGYRDWDSSIGFNAFDLQRHTASVDEHTDDVSIGRYFGLYVVQSKKATQATRRFGMFDTRTELRYFNQLGEKKRVRLRQGELLVFNPRMKHELIYFGERTTIALFDVKKMKKP